ncbi:MAG: helix-turn-helix transcriptional regulator [Polyangiales bacterium]
MKLGDRVRILRERRGWTQAELADRAGSDSMRRTYVAKVEIGLNQLTSYELRAALAKGFGLSLEEFDAYLDGRLSVDEVARRGEEVESDPLALLGHEVEIPKRAVPPPPAVGAEKAWQATLWKTASQMRDDPTDYLALQRALPKALVPKEMGFDSKAVARGLLNAARALQERSLPVSIETLLAELATQRES